MTERVVCTIDGGVADVRLNRPDKLNALDVAMFDALIEVGESLKRDRTVRAVVLSGNGRAFCAGLDFEWFKSMTEVGPGVRDEASEKFVQKGDRITNRAQHAAHLWFEMPAPVIAAVHGVAVGGGLDLALAADIRIVAPDTTMGSFEIRWGMLPDLCGSVMITRVVAPDVAKLLALTGRSITGEEALRLGIATLISERPLEDAITCAREIADKNPDAVKRAKWLLNFTTRANVEDGIEAEHRILEEVVGQPNQLEAVAAFFEKRVPRFAE